MRTVTRGWAGWVVEASGADGATHCRAPQPALFGHNGRPEEQCAKRTDYLKHSKLHYELPEAPFGCWLLEFGLRCAWSGKNKPLRYTTNYLVKHSKARV